jgi:oligopeptide/dipeptide ABC transporter ATP-binding protein
MTSSEVHESDVASVPSARTAVLAVDDLSVDYLAAGARAHAVRKVSWSVQPGQVLAIVGESGSGKSATVKAIMGVLEPSGEIVGGRILLDGDDLLRRPAKARRQAYGAKLSMVQQDAIAALNPVMTIGGHLAEVIRAHDKSVSRPAARERAVELLDMVGIADPRRRMRQHPHQFSGGMCQRVLIAMAVANSPAVLIADEPTTALDVTYQAQIMELLIGLKERTGMSLVLITHDLALVSEYADELAVMYGGRIMEKGPVSKVSMRSAHPYTAALLKAIPDVEAGRKPLAPVPGVPPSATDLPAGCPFHPRCSWRVVACSQEMPVLEPVAKGHESACLRRAEVRSR